MSTSTSGDELLKRLPQDAALGTGAGGRPDLSALAGSVERYSREHLASLEVGDFDARVRSCWGLVANGAESIPWVLGELAQHDVDRIEDAAGVLHWTGTPTEMVSQLRELLDSLPEGQAADAIAAVIESVAGPEPATAAAPPGAELFDGSLAAFTSTIWFVNAPFDDVVETGTDWLNGLGGRRISSLESGPLRAMLATLEPWVVPSSKQIWVPTDSEWTAIFSQGSDISTHRVVASRIGCRSLRTNYSPRVVREGTTISHGDRAFWFDGADGSSRTIQATFQSRWDWHLSGVPLPFENTDAYAARRISDRFTLEMLNSYCESLGIRRADPSFYLPGGLLIEHDGNRTADHRARSLTAADWLVANR